jgi:hypothetical protein
VSSDQRRQTSHANKMKDSDLQLMFPTLPREQSDNYIIRSTKPVRSIHCILNVEKNGKFTIHIDESTDSNLPGTSDDNHWQNGADPTIDSKASPAGLQHAPLRGEWYITPNPYCITDRHYDTLTLVSEPRIRRAPCPEGIITELARLELRCKLWGRYGVGPIRNKLGLGHGREMGRMTHGTVMVVREYVNQNRLSGQTEAKRASRKEIIATFMGRGMISCDCSEDGNTVHCEDEEFANNDDSEIDQDEYEGEF